MPRPSFIAVLACVATVSGGVRAQDAPSLLPPAASAKPQPAATAPTRSARHLTCGTLQAWDAKSGRCTKAAPAATAQVPDEHRDDAVTVPKATWEQMGTDLKQAALRIIQLKKQLAELTKQLDDLKKKQGCDG